jgi:hypothetical protein
MESPFIRKGQTFGPARKAHRLGANGHGIRLAVMPPKAFNVRPALMQPYSPLNVRNVDTGMRRYTPSNDEVKASQQTYERLMKPK